MNTIKTEHGWVEYARFAGSKCESIQYGIKNSFDDERTRSIEKLLDKHGIDYDIHEMGKKTKMIPIGSHYALIIEADPADILFTDEYDVEDRSEYRRATLMGCWVGYTHDNNMTAEKYAKQLRGRLFNFGVPKKVLEHNRQLTEEQHRYVISLLQSIYKDIVEKLDADLQHNLFRAHHQGGFGSAGYDRYGVIRDIERFLCKVKRI